MSVLDSIYEDIIDTIREPLLALDSDLKVLSANRSFYNSFKVTPEETVGKLIYDLGNRQWDIPKLRMLLEDIIPKANKFDDYEVEHVFPGLGHKIMLLNARRIIHGAQMILLAIEDITERRRLESGLIDSEERFRRLFETAKDGLLLIDKETGNIVNANKAIANILGHSSQELIGRKLSDVGLLKDIKDFKKTIFELELFGLIDIVDTQVETKQGLHINADIYLVDRARFVQCNVRDITERKQSEEFIKNIFETVDEGFIVIDREYRIISANKAYLNMVSMPLEAVTGQHCYEVSHRIPTPCYEANEDCAVRRTFADGLPHKANHVHHDKEGNAVYVETKTYPVKDRSGDIISVIEIIINITENKRLENQLHQAQKMETVGQLAGGITHDFNNILTAIMVNCNLLQMELKEDKELKMYVDEILAAADKAADLTKSLLLFSRKQEISPKLINLNELIERIQKIWLRLIGEDIDFKTILTGSDLIVMADSGQIEQVLMNFITNARDSMPDGGLLSISTELIEVDDEFIRAHGYGESGMYALVTVSDTGIGMDEKTREKIFEPFFTTKEAGKGTGLGLSIVYGIIRQHNGYINVYSEPDKGTTFRIYLPIVNAAAEVNKPVELVEPAGGTETVLLAEDNADVRKITRSVLEAFGYTVLEAVDGEDAVNSFMKNKDSIQLLIFDVIMPVKSGKDAYEEILSVRPDINILFLSGYTIDIVGKQGIFAEGLNFISKPVSSNNLLSKIREILDK